MAYAAHATQPFDFDDLLALPDDGLRYEVIDGALVVNAAPSWQHQRIADRLVRVRRPRHARPREAPEVTIMPRSGQDILDHADELAKRLEDYEPSPDDEVAVAEHLLRRAAVVRASSERQISEAVDAPRQAGISWKRIGVELGISAQAAQQRYGSVSKSA
ncbi:MAG: PDDEXK family nuclease [Acidimicrobiales bacterium]